MRRDLVISPFGGDARAIVDLAVRAEDDGYDGVWVFDHITSLASLTAPGVGASRDPFALLGAIAARTSRVRLGTLVANLHNRHPAQLALAMDTLGDLAPGRVVCGLGSGSAPSSPFAREDAALRRAPAPAPERRERLGEYVTSLRAIWNGSDAVGRYATDGLAGVVAGQAPPIVLGGGSDAMVELAGAVADGINLNTAVGPRQAAQVARARSLGDARVRAGELPGGFEVSLFVAQPVGAGADLGVGEVEVPDGVDRLVFLTRP
ncbi:hypothetical protein C8046_13235 [Serinibacter arcticus]|uniref:Luciferase-like domain-containing protein n=1 Tax=Serinibacter arcticus TaxID=1655435 RepID=A0A2U1ZWW7_9MICO|nr:LLM class flavin-dependent oxidoreductase [Serinibacter arcticus]PWD51475.1 hypothetical protein C8046_13235 [Serinibacter arcticus]